MYHDAAFALLSAQVGSNDALDGKASQALTIGSTALPLTFALLNLTRSPADTNRLTLGTADTIFVTVAILFYLGIIACNVRISVLNNRGLEFRPKPGLLRDYVPSYAAKPYGGRALKGWVADEYLASTIENDTFLQGKARYVFRAQFCQQVELAILAAWAGWTLLTCSTSPCGSWVGTDSGIGSGCSMAREVAVPADVASMSWCCS